MPRCLVLLACLVIPMAMTPVAAADAGRLPLWNGAAPVGAPGSTETEAADAFITVHLPEGTPEGSSTPAVVICPGGGYGGLVTGPEGHGIAAWLNEHGIAGIVLEYRLPAGRSFVPLSDASRALRTVRANAAAWRIDPRKVGIIGFSAGGHLASTAATHFDTGDAQATDAISKQSSRPDFAILVYPVVTFGDVGHSGSRTNLLGENPTPELLALFSNEKQVTKQTPPTYLAHAVDDSPVPIANSRLFHEACTREGVPSRLLELPSGGHGLDGYKGPNWDAWQSGVLAWLSSLDLAPAASSAAPRGVLVWDEQQPGLALHSAHWATPFIEAMNERARADVHRAFADVTPEKLSIREVPAQHYKVPPRDSRLTPASDERRYPDGRVEVTLHLPNCCFPAYRTDGKPSVLRVLDRRHALAAGLPETFSLPRTEMYDEPFHVPAPDEVVVEERFEDGSWFRSVMVWNLGRGKVISIRPGHETYPIFHEATVLKLVENACRISPGE